MDRSKLLERISSKRNSSQKNKTHNSNTRYIGINNGFRPICNKNPDIGSDVTPIEGPRHIPGKKKK